jgi:hypothetical protein
MPGDKRWILVRGDAPGGFLTAGDDDGHGTCVLAMAASPKFGVAKKVNVVIVKVPVWPDNQGVLRTTLGSTMAGIIAVLADVRERGLQGKAVVNLSAGRK